mgnify:CR=1 FL=1
MKKRFWFVYYWLMVSYLVLALITIINLKQTVTYLPFGQTCEEIRAELAEENRIRKEKGEGGVLLDFRLSGCQPYERPTEISDAFQFFNDVLFFDFMYEGTYSRKVENYHPFILVFLMTLIRFIFTGKHIWQRP